MCGVAGCVGPRGTTPLLADSQVLRHRGPDSYGCWQADGVALQHWRLSIIDVSDAGRQPMVSACGRFTLAYNGEIYNHRELRAELERAGVALPRPLRHRGAARGASSAGARNARCARCTACSPSRCGTPHERTLHWRRDRLGEKPLYYGWGGRRFVFGSELKALRPMPGVRPPGDRPRRGRCSTCRYNYVPAPHSIYRGVLKLAARRHYLTVEARRAAGRPRAACPTGRRSRRRAGRWPSPSGAARPRRSTSSTRLLRDRDRLPHAVRRPARRVPLGRHRLVPRRGPHAGAGAGRCGPSPSASPRSDYERGARTRRGRAPPRHRAHRAGSSPAPTRRPSCPPARACYDEPLRGLLADPHRPRVSSLRPAPRDRGPLGRRRRRGVRRLQPLPVRRGRLEPLGPPAPRLRSATAALARACPGPLTGSGCGRSVERVRPNSVGAGHLADRVQGLRAALAPRRSPSTSTAGSCRLGPLRRSSGAAPRAADGPFDRRTPCCARPRSR